MLKENAPEIKIGSTVKVHVKIREGERERIQVFEGTVIARNNSGISENLPFAAFLTVLGLSVCSRFTPRMLIRLSWFAWVRFAVQSFIICVTEWAKPQRLKSIFNNFCKDWETGKCPPFFCCGQALPRWPTTAF